MWPTAFGARADSDLRWLRTSLNYRCAVTQTIDGYVAVALLPLGSVALAVSFALSRRFGLPFLRVLFAGLTLGVILSVTLFGRMLKLEHWGSGDLTVSWLTDDALWSGVADIDRPWLLNFALYMPAGFSLARAFVRAAVVVLLLAMLSLFIEFVQRWTMLGTGDPADLVANVLGASLGASGAALVAVRTADAPRRGSHS